MFRNSANNVAVRGAVTDDKHWRYDQDRFLCHVTPKGFGFQFLRHVRVHGIDRFEKPFDVQFSFSSGNFSLRLEGAKGIVECIKAMR